MVLGAVMSLTFMGYHPKNSNFETLNCHFRVPKWPCKVLDIPSVHLTKPRAAVSGKLQQKFRFTTALTSVRLQRLVLRRN